ncbi:CpsD/CapB family tyrosine-protein kinase [Brochothrix thermosphacta]|uniref:CpsD/CapB family tyrosine-protein kinase n=1 Tax=Brochothrix thermosphacta TaxID=2756 RepID=UPI00265CF692|nr:CpsD/CapB family tyrosine-protein kinase [Brochothrix thermosphacta]WKK69130.1 CpsD/CapB family tyrosine-protein kinase [Brochothrix thermosphacta]
MKRKLKQNLIIFYNSKSPVSEQIKAVRTSLNFATIDQDAQVILITSPTPSSGKSVVSSNLAVSYAQQDKKVLIIDGDLRKATQHYQFKADPYRGLSSLLIGKLSIADAIQETFVPNLSVLTSGPMPPNPAELLSINKLDTLMDEFKKIFDIIIIDTPPVVNLTDAVVISRVADGIILVVRANHTQKNEVSRSVEILKTTNKKLFGTILNDAKHEVSDYYYY